MIQAETIQVTIFVGLREGYTDFVHVISEVEGICQEYVDDIGLCVTVTPTTYVYKGGRERGAIVGLINYPRFPSTVVDLSAKAVRLAALLKSRLKQLRVSVVTPKTTYMIGDTDNG